MVWSVRRATLGVAFLTIGAPSASYGGSEGEACRQRDVVEFVARAVQMENMYAEFQPTTIGERPTTVSSTVLCSAYVLRTEYDFTRFRRMTWFQLREYLVREINGG